MIALKVDFPNLARVQSCIWKVCQTGLGPVSALLHLLFDPKNHAPIFHLSLNLSMQFLQIENRSFLELTRSRQSQNIEFAKKSSASDMSVCTKFAMCHETSISLPLICLEKQNKAKTKIPFTLLFLQAVHAVTNPSFCSKKMCSIETYTQYLL